MDTQLTIKKKAELIIAEIDAILHHGNTNPDGIGYLDILRIIDRVNQHFSDDCDGTPKLIEGSMDIAKGLCSPSWLDRLNSIRKGLGTLVAAGGGGALIWGIITIMSKGVVVISGGGLMGGPAITTILLTGPFAILGGILAVGIGMYFISSMINPKQRALKAHEIIRESIIKWGAQLENTNKTSRFIIVFNFLKKYIESFSYAILNIFIKLFDAIKSIIFKNK